MEAMVHKAVSKNSNRLILRSVSAKKNQRYRIAAPVPGESDRRAVEHQPTLQAGSQCGENKGTKDHGSKQKAWATNQKVCLGLRKDSLSPFATDKWFPANGHLWWQEKHESLLHHGFSRRRATKEGKWIKRITAKGRKKTEKLDIRLQIEPSHYAQSYPAGRQIIHNSSGRPHVARF